MSETPSAIAERLEESEIQVGFVLAKVMFWILFLIVLTGTGIGELA